MRSFKTFHITTENEKYISNDLYKQNEGTVSNNRLIYIDKIKSVFKYLSPKDKNLIRMRYVENLTYKEMGYRLNITPQAVHKKMKKLLKTVDEYFSNQNKK